VSGLKKWDERGTTKRGKKNNPKRGLVLVARKPMGGVNGGGGALLPR